MNDASQTSLTPQEIEQVRIYGQRYERAWRIGDQLGVEAAAAGADSRIRPALIQHLVELDIRFRVVRGQTIDLQLYLHRWPDLDAAAVNNAYAAAVESSQASHSFVDQSMDQHPFQTSSALPCSTDEFLRRLRKSQILPEGDIAAVANPDSMQTSAASVAERLVADGKLTLFQSRTLLFGSDDPIRLGEYVVQDVVGRGGMGTVYRALHRRMKRTVAIKVLRRDMAHADLLAKRFLREVEVAARLCHPNIVTAYDASEQDGISYLVSEFVEGQNLSELVKEYGPLSLPLAIDVIHQAARALEYAHGEGVIHRDIKPSNLLIDDAGNIKLLDVGLARINSPTASEIEHASDLTTTGMIMGTVDYMSPEQAQNTRLADERSDVYSLGCTLFFLLTGRAPYGTGTGIERLLAHREQPIPSVCRLSSAIPQSIDLLLQSVMAKNPRERLASMNALVHQLEILRRAGLPDVTLPLSEISDGLMSTDGSQPEETSGMKMPERAVPLVECGATFVQEMNDLGQPATEFMPAAVSTVSSHDGVSSDLIRPASWWFKILPWLILSVVAALAILAVMNRDKSHEPTWDSEKSVSQMVVADLTGFSETEVQSYRNQWAQSLALEENTSVNGVDFVFIPPGAYLYGDEATPTRLSRGYYLSQTEVTVGQYRSFVKAHNYQTQAETNGEGGWGQDPESQDARRWIQSPLFHWNNLGAQFVSDQHPATSLTYTDMLAFCDWLSHQTKRTIRLPTEQEWEYACRCGRPGRWSFGDDPELLPEYAWFEGNSDQDIHPSRQLKPNAWGLYDMHGNEFEQCAASDRNLPDMSVSSGNGPIRGGGIFSPAEETGSTSRQMRPLNSPTHGAFRILMELP